jgi:deoxyribonuclease IV
MTETELPRAPTGAFPDSGPLGAHVSSAGGLPEAPPRAAAVSATALQLFTKQASRWAEHQCTVEEIAAFRAALGSTAVRTTVAHDSYLINLASPDVTLRARSLASFVSELRRSDALGIDYVVSHPGNFMDDRASGLARNADAITAALETAPGRVMVLLEMTAGSGTGLGATFEEMAALVETVATQCRDRIGVCVDTCHVFAAGYDLVNDFDGVWARFGDVVGWDRLKLLHLNDSKFGLGTHRDRHELIGEGHLGADVFRRIMTDPRLAPLAKVIETPKLEDATHTDTRMLARLRAYAGGEAGAGAAPRLALQPEHV